MEPLPHSTFPTRATHVRQATPSPRGPTLAPHPPHVPPTPPPLPNARPAFQVREAAMSPRENASPHPPPPPPPPPPPSEPALVTSKEYVLGCSVWYMCIYVYIPFFSFTQFLRSYVNEKNVREMRVTKDLQIAMVRGL